MLDVSLAEYRYGEGRKAYHGLAGDGTKVLVHGQVNSRYGPGSDKLYAELIRQWQER